MGLVRKLCPVRPSHQKRITNSLSTKIKPPNFSLGGFILVKRLFQSFLDFVNFFHK